MQSIVLTASQREHFDDVKDNVDPNGGMKEGTLLSTKMWLYGEAAFLRRTGRTTVQAFAIAKWLVDNPGETCIVADHAGYRNADTDLANKVIKLISPFYEYEYNVPERSITITSTK